MIFLRIPLSELREHLDHKIHIDYGLADRQHIEYSIWCENCNEAIGPTIKEVG